MFRLTGQFGLRAGGAATLSAALLLTQPAAAQTEGPAEATAGSTIAEETYCENREVRRTRWCRMKNSPPEYEFSKRRSDRLAGRGSAGALGMDRAQARAVGNARPLANGYVLSTELLSGETIVEDEGVQNGLREVLNGILPARPAGFPEPVFILTDYEHDHIRATEAGAIIIPAGTLEAATSRDAMAFYLGHEAGHLLADHFADLKTSEDISRALGGIAMSTQYIDGISGGHGSDTLDSVREGALAARAFNERIVAPAWRASHEYRADEFAVDLIVNAGLSTAGGEELLEARIRLEEAQEQQMERLCGKPGINLGPLGDIFDGPSSRLPGGGTGSYRPNSPICRERGDLLSNLFKSRPSAKRRYEKMIKYFRRYYSERVSVGEQKYSEGNFLKHHSPKGAISRILMANQAWRMLQQPDITEDELKIAERLARRALVSGSDPAPKPRFVLYHIQLERGRLRQALAHLRVSIKARKATRPMYIAYSEGNFRLRQFNEALRTVLDAGDIFGHAHFYPLRIKYLMALNLTERADKVYAQCQATRMNSLIHQCEQNRFPQLAE